MQEDFIELGTADILLKNVYLGLMAVKGNETFPGPFPMQEKGPGSDFSASFDYFRINSKWNAPRGSETDGPIIHLEN